VRVARHRIHLNRANYFFVSRIALFWGSVANRLSVRLIGIGIGIGMVGGGGGKFLPTPSRRGGKK
jgi:hypothetical protein